MSEMGPGRCGGCRSEQPIVVPVRSPQPVLAAIPDVLTVAEAARYLRIGRGSAYELARRFRETNGAEGLPVVVLGRSLRVPRHALVQLLAVEAPDGGPRQEKRADGAA